MLSDDILGRFRSTEYEPPFDDKPCPMCPSAIRNLSAVAHNLLNSWAAYQASPTPHGWAKFARKLNDLKMARESVQPFSDAHFSDENHSHFRSARSGDPEPEE